MNQVPSSRVGTARRMDPLFARFANSLHPTFARLVVAPPVIGGAFPKTVPERGIYLFSEVGQHLYVGRTNRIRKRYAGHCNPGATHFTAAFAFLLARKDTGRLRASYKAGADSRSGLMLDPAFAEAFRTAKGRIRSMEFRYVEEVDAVAQCLLEVYAAVVLATPYNDFDNH